MKHHSRISLLIAATLVSACAIWPEYQRPVVDIPANYKETFPGWKVAEPGGKPTDGTWWKIYQDSQLDSLIRQAASANQNILAAAANYRQSEALSKSARSALYPSLAADASATRSQRSANTSSSGQSTQAPSNSVAIGLTAGWEADLWGKIRRGIESGDAKLAASAADLAAANLSVQATLAQNYFQLRVLDTQQKLFNDTVAAYEKSLKLTRNRYAVGLASRTDVAQSEAQLKSTQAQATDNSIQRKQLEHAIAVLTGQPPSTFALPAQPFTEPGKVTLPTIPASLPSELLERRPDIAAAERRAAAANAEIGIARAALFPSLSLGASLGFQSTRLADLLTVPSRVWSLGPLLAWSLFDGGQRQAQTDAAIAAYDATVSNYKQTVLTGFQEVEDSLSALRLLEQEAAEQEAAVKFARESVQQTENRYKAGTVDYLSVVTVQTTALSNERAALSVLGRRLTASVGLIKALGGSADPTHQPGELP